MAEPMRLALWHFSEDDFAAWCELVGTPQVADFAAYLTLLAAVQADQERQGREVVRVKLTVAAMQAALAAHDLENTADNRAAIIAWTLT